MRCFPVCGNTRPDRFSIVEWMTNYFMVCYHKLGEKQSHENTNENNGTQKGRLGFKGL